MQVEKRDGRLEPFQLHKIIEAVRQAGVTSNISLSDAGDVAQKVENKFQGKAVVSVDDIHTAVENLLMASRHKDVAREYVKGRVVRDVAREAKSKLNQDLLGFLEQTSEEFLKENANKPASVVTSHRDLIAGIVSKHLTANQVLSKDVAEAHTKGVIHVHDLDYGLSPLTNCCLVNYRDMLENGFCIGDAKIESPRSIGTAATILTQIAQAVASSQYGGQSHAHIDTGLKPYVQRSWEKIQAEQQKYNLPDAWAKEKIEKEVYDAMQSLLYQINSLTTTNGQTPFQTISLGLDTSWEGRLITEQYLKVHMKGLGKDGVTPTFPKVVFFLQENVNMVEGDPNYDLKKLAVECASKRIYPDWVYVPANQAVTGCNLPVTPMGCRSFLGKWENTQGEEVLDGRFNLGVVSLNLPYIVMESRTRGEEFNTTLHRYAYLAKQAHMDRVGRLKSMKAKTNPVMWVHGVLARLDPEDTIEQVLFDGRASISLGYVGLYEAVQILCGKEDKEMALQILQELKNLCDQWKVQDNLGWNVYGTPSESLCYRAATAVKRDFGEVVDKPYLTNSFHYPVWNKVHVQDKWGYEKGFELVSTGGNIVYVETPNLSRNLAAYEGLVDYACHLGLHYFALNTPVDQCFDCGYQGEFRAHLEGYTCPSCGNTDPSTISVLRRVSGYISAPNSRPFNYGKQNEVMDRVKHQ